jgi:hemerythrin superfamily protein
MLRPYTVLRNFRLISPITAIATVVTTASTAANMPTRISDVVKHDHAELKDFYGKIINATDDDSKVRWQNQFTWELARHSVGEELVVYPAMEKHMSNGKELADRDRASHQTVCVTNFRISSLLTL